MKRKKLLIVNNNMYVGGTQKALIALLKFLAPVYNITLLLFYADGPLINEIPPEVKVIQTKTAFRYMGMSQRDCKLLSDKLLRGFFALIAKVFGFRWSCKLIELSMYKDRKQLNGYDAVISYVHNCPKKVFYGGTASYVLKIPNKLKKICYIHCDYELSGNSNSYNDKVYMHFDAINCVSESVKNRFVSMLPCMRERTYSLKNPVDTEEVLRLSKIDTFEYDKNYINLLSVARLAEEKGIERFVRVMARSKQKKIRYYVVGDGASKGEIEKMICDYGLEDQVFLLGESTNPYRYMETADFLVVPSFHEAAPVVFQEAIILGLPVLTTRTLSADEMIGDEHGIVVDNTENALLDALESLSKFHQDRDRFKHTCDATGDDFYRLFTEMIS